MKHYKSERLKKLETELEDLERWLQLGLVPKRDVKKYQEEIQAIQGKIEEERERLQFLKESGEMEEYVAPKRNPARPGYSEMPTIPDFEATEALASGENALEMEPENTTEEVTVIEEKEETTIVEEEEEESYFSDKRRWRRGARGGIVDPDLNEW